MYTTICTRPLRRIRPKTMDGRRPAMSPARRRAPIEGRSFRMTPTRRSTPTPMPNAVADRTRKRIMFPSLGRMMELGPAAKRVAPTRPPIRAWLLDVGSTQSQVTRSHTIAPITPPMMIAIEWRNCASLRGSEFTPRTLVSMMPRPIVSAMAFVMKTIPTKFPTAAIATAFVGVRTFVATMVAIAFAASWNPLKKSKEKTRRIAIRMISKNAIVSSGIERVPDLSLVLRHDVAQDVRDIFAVVRCLLESLRDFLQFDDSNRVGVLEQRGDRVVQEVVRDVLEVMDLDGDPLDFVPLFHVADHADGLLQEQRGLRDRVGELDHRFGRLVDLVQIQPIRGRVDHVEDVVQRTREGLDVLAVDGRDEGPVQGLEDVVREVVAAMLDVLDRASLRRDILEMPDHVEQRDRSVVHGGRDPFEEIEEPTFLRNDPLFQTQRSTPGSARGSSRILIKVSKPPARLLLAHVHAGRFELRHQLLPHLAVPREALDRLARRLVVPQELLHLPRRDASASRDALYARRLHLLRIRHLRVRSEEHTSELQS